MTIPTFHHELNRSRLVFCIETYLGKGESDLYSYIRAVLVQARNPSYRRGYPDKCEVRRKITDFRRTLERAITHFIFHHRPSHSAFIGKLLQVWRNIYAEAPSSSGRGIP